MDMKLKNITNAIYSSEDKSSIDCMITVEGLTDPLPFTARVNDVEEHGRQIYAALRNGDYGPIGEYVSPPLPPQPKTPKTTGTQTV